MGCDYELCIKCKEIKNTVFNGKHTDGEWTCESCLPSDEKYREQYTLNDLIERLRELPQDMPILLGDAFSYRGYYEDISFEPFDMVTVKEALIEAENSNGAIFEGWKGGDFRMDNDTPVWYAHEGSSGSEIVFITVEGVILTRDE